MLTLAEQLLGDRIPSVEEIQDIVEETLLQSPYRKTAKAYIIYRDQHARLREIINKMEVDLVDQYLSKADWKINENSNMDYSLQGLNNYISSEVSKVYWLNEIYPPEISKAHTDGDFHIHDLSLLSVYCVGWDLYDLLIEGFRGVSGKVESSPAKHLRSALGQVVNFFYTLQGEAAGAQAFSQLRHAAGALHPLRQAHLHRKSSRPCRSSSSTSTSRRGWASRRPSPTSPST